MIAGRDNLNGNTEQSSLGFSPAVETFEVMGGIEARESIKKDEAPRPDIQRQLAEHPDAEVIEEQIYQIETPILHENLRDLFQCHCQRNNAASQEHSLGTHIKFATT